MALAETIKTSSSRKHLAAAFRLVGGVEEAGWGGGRRGPLARQQRQHACLNECAIAQSAALRCQITWEWTAATSTKLSPAVCHGATVLVPHSVWSAEREEEGEQRSGKSVDERGKRTRSRRCCFLKGRTAMDAFLSVPSPSSTRRGLRGLSSATLEQRPRPVALT